SSVSTNPLLTFCQYSRDEIARYLSASAGCLSEGTTQLSFSTYNDYPVGGSPYSVAVGDFNGDGKQDLAVAKVLSNNVSVLLVNGTGRFRASLRYPAGGSPSSVAVGDFNGDGKQNLDVANFSSNSNNVSVLLGTGTGSFQAALSYPAGSSPRSVAVGDFNGDGKQDLAVANSGSDNEIGRAHV